MAAQREQSSTIRAEASAEDVDELERRLVRGSALHNIVADRFPDADADTYVRELEKLERELFEGRH